MTDTQLLTLALAIIIPLAMLIFSNSRVSDVKETLNTRVTDAKETLRAELTTAKTELKADIAGMRMETNNKLDHLLEIVSKHDEKLGR